VNTFSSTNTFTQFPTFDLRSGGLFTNPADGELRQSYQYDATYSLYGGFGGGATSTAKIVAVVSGGNKGEVQFQIADAGAFGWRFVESATGTEPVRIAGTAPASSLFVTTAGNVQTAGGFCFSANQCIRGGAGAPVAGLCGASNTGSIWLRNDATSASTVEYVCQGSTWTAISVP